MNFLRFICVARALSPATQPQTRSRFNPAYPPRTAVGTCHSSPGKVENAARVLALNQSVTVPYGSFNNCVETAEFTPVEPESLDAPDHKFYAPGIGFVLEVAPSGQRQELIAIERQ